VTRFKGLQVTFDRADLDHLDDGQLKIICVFPHITNRLAVLETQVYAHMNVFLNQETEQAKRDAALCGYLESIILIAGELKEAWESIQKCYYGTKVAKAMNSKLPLEIQECLKRCGSHFSGDSLVHFLRNNFAHHNSPDIMLATLKAAPRKVQLSFYVLEQRVFFFDYATKVRMAAIADKLGVDDVSDIVHPMTETIMGHVFHDVSLPMLVIANDILLTLKTIRTPIEVNNVPEPTELRADVFFDYPRT
jgi:hypothetical protein